jgi:catechol 2,3-dioxygenase-like lactoylglutathione lyase family enzyme
VLIRTVTFDESVAFYGSRLGWPLTMSWEADDDQGRGAIFAASAEARVELIEGGHPPTGLTLSCETQDVEADAARLGDRLVQPPTDQPWGHRSCEGVDPNGVTLVFFQVVAPDPAGH